MRDVSPEELFDQLLAELEIIVSTPQEQRAWLVEHGFPTDELMLQLDDSLGTFTPRLREAGLLDDLGEAAVARVLARLREVPSGVYQMNHDGLDQPEWEPPRRAAAHAVSVLRANRNR